MKDMTMNIEFHIQTDDDISKEKIHDTVMGIINRTVPTETKDFVITRREYKVTDDFYKSVMNK